MVYIAHTNKGIFTLQRDIGEIELQKLTKLSNNQKKNPAIFQTNGNQKKKKKDVVQVHLILIAP